MDRRTGGGARRIRDEKGETEKRIYNGNGVPSKGMRCWGRIWKGSSIGLAKQGICQWRDTVESQERGKCRGCMETDEFHNMFSGRKTGVGLPSSVSLTPKTFLQAA